MSDETNDGLRERLTRGSEDALGRLAQDLLENPLVSGAIARAFEAREKASQAQELAMGALNIPSAADLERLTRRLRSVSQRLEGIEDGVDRLDERIAGLGGQPDLERRLDGLADRLVVIEGKLDDQAKRAPAPPPRNRGTPPHPAQAPPPRPARRGPPDRAAPGGHRRPARVDRQGARRPAGGPARCARPPSPRPGASAGRELVQGLVPLFA